MIKKLSKSLIFRLLSIFLLLIIIFGVISWSIWIYLLQPINANNPELERFVVNRGEGISSISQKLQDKGLIKNSYAFKVYYQLNKDKYLIQAGSFELSQAMDIKTILEILGEGTDDIWITFPEGMRREEIANSLNNYGLINFDLDLFLTQTVALEGRLFPDTYLVPKEISTQQLIVLLNNTFDKRVEPFMKEIEQSDTSFNELLTMASLLEREARTLEQMKVISGVLWRRLAIGMPLQVDATLQYAKGYDEAIGSWWAVPLASDKQIDSRFNTYQNPGLPPRPICNPGINAIEASIRPASSEYLFYIHDRQGQVHFAKNLEEHNRNINKYLR